MVEWLWIAWLPGQEFGVPSSGETAPLALKGRLHKRGPTASVPLADLLVDEFNNLIRQPYRDLLAHPGHGTAVGCNTAPAPFDTGSRDYD
jgi:hypothetical protein